MNAFEIDFEMFWRGICALRMESKYKQKLDIAETAAVETLFQWAKAQKIWEEKIIVEGHVVHNAKK